MKKTKILLNCNAPFTSSGYGSQAADFVPLIKKEGHEIGVVAYYGVQGGEIEWKTIPLFPAIDDPWGSDALLLHNIRFKADVIMTLQDIFVLDPEKLKQYERWIPIVPIDHEPTPPAVLDRLRLAYRIVTYSKFGHEQLRKEGLHSTYIPHSVDTNIFQPIDRSECRRIVETWCKKQIPDDVFVVGMVAENKQNPPRKSFQEAMDAFKMFLEKKNGRALMYFHTNLTDPRAGFPIMDYAKVLGIQDHVAMTENFIMRFGLKKEQMPILYNSFDVLLEPSLYEGFGVPPFEAQGCGVPAIVNDFTALRDAVIDGETGYKIKVAYKRYSPVGSYVGVPSVESIFDCLCKVQEANRVKMGKRARKFILDNYSLEHVFKTHWIPFLKMLDEEIHGKDSLTPKED